MLRGREMKASLFPLASVSVVFSYTLYTFEYPSSR